MAKTAVYPGSFAPITLGHVDIVKRASALFDKIVMAVVKNPGKQSVSLSFSERFALVQESVKSLKNVTVVSFEGLTVDLARAYEASIIIRGLRAVSDFEYEFAMSQMNKRLCPGVETVFMMADLEYQFISSSMINEVARLGGTVDGLAPTAVVSHFKSLSENLI
ncbi:MAG: pantetheine-phosphate adenylyltransferase [Cyanobacteria bacterium P01_H01_bin.74]